MVLALGSGREEGEGGKGEGTRPKPTLLSLEVAILRPSVKLFKGLLQLATWEASGIKV